MAAQPISDTILNAPAAAVLLDPLRLRLLDELREPNSASGLAPRLKVPRQKLNYHLRELEKQGLVSLVEERKKGNCIERVVRATAQAFVINPAALGPLAVDPERIRDHFSSAYLVALAAQAIRDVAALRERASKADKKLATFSLQTEIRFASAADRAVFSVELTNAIAALAAKYHNENAPEGRAFQFFLGAYPAVAKKQESATADERK